MIERELRKKLADELTGNLPTEFTGVVIQEEIIEYKQQGIEASIFLINSNIEYSPTNIIRNITYNITISCTGRDGVATKSAQTRLEALVEYVEFLFIQYWETLNLTKRLKVSSINYSSVDDVGGEEYARVATISIDAVVWELYK